MSESRTTKGIYKADALILLVRFFRKVKRACMIRCMNVDEARGVCKDRSRWRSVVLPTAMGKGRKSMHVCI